MKALDRKLLRDLKSLWAQALTIALVVASGLGGFIGSLSTVDTLAGGRDRYYAQARLADVFAQVRRAPEHVAARVSELPGVAQVQTSVIQGAQLDLPGVSQPLTARVIGGDVTQWTQGLNRLSLRDGRWPAPGTTEVLVNEAFAQARGLRPGAQIHALLCGKRQRLTIAGIALSPEYVFAAAGSGMNDDTSFGIFWMDRARLAPACDMDGAFNTITLSLAEGVRVAPALDDIDRLLTPYGSRGPQSREDQPSHKAVTQEIREQRVFGMLLPAIVLAVAAFILHVVLDRQVGTQRDQIATLKALGYPDSRIVGHYLQLALAISAGGILLGIVVGEAFGRLMTDIYLEFFRFPECPYASSPWAIVCGTAAFAAASLAGAWGAARRLAALAPAEAMRPPAPPIYRRLGRARATGAGGPGPRTKIVLRNLQRRAGRAAFTTVGIACAVAILIGGTWWRDALDYLIDVQFSTAQPADLYLGFPDPLSRGVEYELRSLPGVLQAEVRRSVPVRIHAGHLNRLTTLTGVQEESRLWRLTDIGGQPVPLPADGLLLTDRLAKQLRVDPGDTVHLQFLEGARREVAITIVALSSEPMGAGAFVENDRLRQLAGEGELANGAALTIDVSRRDEVFAALKRTPKVTGVLVKSALVDYFRATTARSILVMTSLLTAFAAAIAVGVVYNSARIALAERSWELATLRVLGLTHFEVTGLLLGELALELLVAIPLGLLGGYWLARLMLGMMASEEFQIPALILPRTYAYAALVTILAGLFSAWRVQHRLAGLDLVAVLKTREQT